MTKHPSDRDVDAAVLIEPVRFDPSDFNHDVNPRDDLDAFVNSRWREKTALPGGRSYWDCFSILNERSLFLQAEIARNCANRDEPAGNVERIIGDFWATGMDTESNGVRGWQILQGELSRIDALESSAYFAAYLREAHAHGNDILFRLDVQPDFADPNRMIAFIVPQGLGLPDRDLYFDLTPVGKALLTAYTVHIARMLELSGLARADSHRLAIDVLKFEQRLARVAVSRRALARDIGKRYNPISIETAEEISPEFSWALFFASLHLRPAKISLATPEFHAEVDLMLRMVSPETWRAYLRFRAVESAAPYLTDEVAAAHEHFHGLTLRGRQLPEPRWKHVLKVLNTHVGEAMGEIYASRYHQNGSFQRLHALVDELRDAMRLRIESLNWMGADTKCAALQKLARLKAKIGYGSQPHDWSDLSTTRSSWFENVIAARTRNMRKISARIDQSADPNEWSLTPQTANARYDPQRNEIVFPLAILQPPLFDPEADPALNYGGIGAVIAHEMTHGYDDQGSRFDAAGRFEDWWSPEDRARFNTLSTKLIESVEAYTSIHGERANGLLTLGENIADMGGLAVSCDALRHSLSLRTSADPMIDGFTQLQRFFLNWATLWRQVMTSDERRLRMLTDPHAPGNVRANIPARSLAAYTEAFGQTAGDSIAHGSPHIW